MKTLWLVRHAKSSWGYDGLADIDRPLNERGYVDAHEMAKRFKKSGHSGLIVSSPAVRAISTALIFARNLGIDPAGLLLRQGLYDSSVKQYRSVIAGLPEDHREALVFGHNPVISETANLLAGIHIDELPTTGVVGITFDTLTWKQAAESGGKLLLYDFPKNKPAP